MTPSSEMRCRKSSAPSDPANSTPSDAHRITIPVQEGLGSTLLSKSPRRHST